MNSFFEFIVRQKALENIHPRSAASETCRLFPDQRGSGTETALSPAEPLVLQVVASFAAALSLRAAVKPDRIAELAC